MVKDLITLNEEKVKILQKSQTFFELTFTRITTVKSILRRYYFIEVGF